MSSSEQYGYGPRIPAPGPPRYWGEGPLESKEAVDWAKGFLFAPLHEVLNNPEKHHPEVIYAALTIVYDVELSQFFPWAKIQKAFDVLREADRSRPSRNRDGIREHLFGQYRKRKKSKRWLAPLMSETE